MAKLMWIAGILLLAAGVALGVMFFVSNASVAAWLNFETVVTMLVGGILALGLGSTVSGLDRLADVPVTRRPEIAPVAVAPAPATAIPEFGRRPAEAPAVVPIEVAPVAVVAAAAESVTEVSEPTRETLRALEQARQNIEQAFDSKPAVTAETVAAMEPEPEKEEPAVEEPADEEAAAEEEPATEDEAVLAEGELYVVEEKIIRLRPARILSDGTVEAETDEGWMRFENLEHLDEYLDAMPPAQA